MKVFVFYFAKKKNLAKGVDPGVFFCKPKFSFSFFPCFSLVRKLICWEYQGFLGGRGSSFLVVTAGSLVLGVFEGSHLHSSMKDSEKTHAHLR